MPKTTNAPSKTGSSRAKRNHVIKNLVRAHNSLYDRVLLQLEGCTIETLKDSKHNFLVHHPDLPGISIACNELVDAVEGFRHFGVM